MGKTYAEILDKGVFLGVAKLTLLENKNKEWTAIFLKMVETMSDHFNWPDTKTIMYINLYFRTNELMQWSDTFVYAEY